MFEPYHLGKITLPNRIVMASLTRNRAGQGNTPTAMMAEYYAQRASAGLIITEATQISPQGQGYQDTPGIHSPEQIAGWKQVTGLVHAEGGRIFVQLWHVGRVSHNSLQPDGGKPVAPSAIRAKTKTFVNGEFVDVSEPRALALSELPGIVDSYRQASRNARAAGFDGVEVHGANGYLLDQFLRSSSNKRVDSYGGTIENRARLLMEVTSAVAAEIGKDRVGVRISPVSPSNDIEDNDPQALFNYVAEEINKIAPIYLHVVEGATGGARDFKPFEYAALRRRFKGTYIANNGYTLELAKDALSSGRADLVAFGKLFISNPDLVERLRVDAPLNEPDKATFYGGGRKGYTDYAKLESSVS